MCWMRGLLLAVRIGDGAFGRLPMPQWMAHHPRINITEKIGLEELLMTINKEDKKLERRQIGRYKEEMEGGNGRW